MEAVNNLKKSLYQLLFTTMKDFIQPGQTHQINEASLQKQKINSILIWLFLILTLGVQDTDVFVGVSFLNNNNKKIPEQSNVMKKS